MHINKPIIWLIGYDWHTLRWAGLCRTLSIILTLRQHRVLVFHLSKPAFLGSFITVSLITWKFLMMIHSVSRTHHNAGLPCNVVSSASQVMLTLTLRWLAAHGSTLRTTWHRGLPGPTGLHVSLSALRWPKLQLWSTRRTTTPFFQPNPGWHGGSVIN